MPPPPAGSTGQPSSENPSKARPLPFGYEITAYGLAPIIAAPMVTDAAFAE